MTTQTDWWAEFGVDSSLGVKSAWTHLWTLSVMNSMRNTADQHAAESYFKSQQKFWSHNLRSATDAHGAQVERGRARCRFLFVSEGVPRPPQLFFPPPAGVPALPPLPPPPQSSEKSGKTVPTLHSFKIKAQSFRLTLRFSDILRNLNVYL